MSYESFKTRVNSLIVKAGGGIAVNFSNDIERGLYRAVFNDGMMITSAPSSLKMTVRYGSGHQMQF